MRVGLGLRMVAWGCGLASGLAGIVMEQGLGLGLGLGAIGFEAMSTVGIHPST